MSIDAVSSDWDSDELRVRALQAAGTAAAPIETIPLRKPASNISSISSSKAEPAAPQFRPELAAPVKRHFMIGLLQTHQEQERLTAKNTRQFEIEVNADIEEIERLSLEKKEALARNAQENATRDTWNVFATVAQYVASASAIVLGAACIASGVGTAPGALLIASGGLGLLNRVMHDTHGWETVVSWFTKSEELQIKIANHIETGMFFLSLGLGLAGGIWAYSAGAFAAAAEGGRQAFMSKAGQAIALAGSFLGAGSRLGGAIVEKRIAYLHARMREIDTRTTTDHHRVYQNSSDAEKMIELNQAVGDELSKSISASQISFD